MLICVKKYLAIAALLVFSLSCMFDDSNKNPSTSQIQQTQAPESLLIGHWKLSPRPLIDTANDIWKDYYHFYADSTYNRTSYHYHTTGTICAPLLENGRYTTSQDIITFEVGGGTRQRHLSILSDSCIMFFVPGGDSSKYARVLIPDSTKE